MSELARSPISMPHYAKNIDRPYDGDPWLKQKEESNKAYEAFTIYLNIDPGKRTVAEAGRRYADKHGLKPTTNQCARWNRKHRWTERADAYDNFLTAKELAAQKRRRIRIGTQHADEAAEIREVLMLPMKKLRDRLKEHGDEFSFIDAMSDEDLFKFARSVASEVPTFQKAEREALASTGDVVAPTKHLHVKGAMVKRILRDRTLRGLTEAMVIEVEAVEVETVVVGDDQDADGE